MPVEVGGCFWEGETITASFQFGGKPAPIVRAVAVAVVK